MANEKPLKIGLAGFGVVGSGLARLLEENRESIQERSGRPLQIASILVQNPHKARAIPFPSGARICSHFSELAQDPEIEVVVEVMGGLGIARDLHLAALTAGKHVVTANKALLAESGEDIFRLAADRGLALGYEASVCGGIPVIQTLRDGLAANKIINIYGILNGTSNYILSNMTSNGLSFAEALSEAQKLGFAELDPSLDIQGVDAAHKLSLLIRLAWGLHYPFAQMPVSGIADLAPVDIRFAREFGYSIKLLGFARLEQRPEQHPDARSVLEAGVFPTLVPDNYLLAKVGYAYNAVRIEGNASGSIFLHGLGAGAMPTASAVAADLISIARGLPPARVIRHTGKEIEILPAEEGSSSYYVRLEVLDRSGTLRVVATAMAENDISIAQATQKGSKDTVPLVLMTHSTTARAIGNALKQLKNSGILTAPPVHYRVMPPPGGIVSLL